MRLNGLNVSIITPHINVQILLLNAVRRITLPLIFVKCVNAGVLVSEDNVEGG